MKILNVWLVNQYFSSDDFSTFDKKCFLEIYSRGGLTIPSANLWEFVCETFSTLDYFDKIILKFPGITEKNAALIVLDLFLLSAKFVCESENCEKWAKKFYPGSGQILICL